MWQWGAFLSGTDFQSIDWPKEYGYLSLLKQALSQGVMPWHMSIVYHMTDRFLGLPETVMLPHVLLIGLLAPGQFIVLNGMVLYTLGFLGCLWARVKLRLCLLAFLFLYLVFHFNGYMQAHLGVGHSMWLGCFLLSWFSMLVLELVDGRRRRTVPALAVVLAAMVMQGAIHPFVWCAWLLLSLSLFSPRLAPACLASLGLAALLAAVRLLPAVLTYWGQHYRYVSGYPNLFLLGLAFVARLDMSLDEWSSLGWWELDYYLGLLGTLGLLWFGLARARRWPELRYRPLDLPMLVVFILSLYRNYGWIARLDLPLAGSERVSSRFIIVPVTLLTFLACARFSREVQALRGRLISQGIGLAAAFVLAWGLWEHAQSWCVASVAAVPGSIMTPNERFPLLVVRPDPLYETSFWLGLALSLSAWLGMALYVRRGLAARSDEAGTLP